MGDDRKKGSRVLRFAVTGALLVSPLATGCDEERVYVNEPAPEPVPNPGIEEDGPRLPPPTPNTPAHPPGTEAPEPTADPTAPDPTAPDPTAPDPTAPTEPSPNLPNE